MGKRTHRILGSRRRFARIALVLAAVLPLGLVFGFYGGSGLASASQTTLKPPVVITSGTIRFCTDFSSPPTEFYSTSLKPEGSDVNIGDAIAAKMNVKVVWEETAFAGIIPALLAKHCDAILSDLYIKPARQLVVNFVPYMYGGESVVVPTANPGNITGYDTSLCGQTVSTVTGTTGQTELTSLDATCTADGKSAIQVDLFTSDVEALENMLTGQSTAYTTGTETAAYYMKKDPNKLKFEGPSFGKILTGIAVNKDDPKLHADITKAVSQIRKDGIYNKILAKWDIGRDALN